MAPGALPRPLTAFFGREAEIGEVAAALASHRLVTLVGPGGVGKTRLAVEVAGGLEPAWREGTYFADLSVIREGGQLLTAIYGLLGAADGPGTMLEQIINAIADRRLVLLLDNCEQIVSDVATLVHALLDACPNLTVLATSREPLGVPGEVVSRVPPLPLPPFEAELLPELTALGDMPVVRLFLDRARLANPGFELSADNVAAVVRVCTAVDGLPLATELAAARVRTLPIQQLAGRLGERLAILTSGPRTAPERQRTVEATVRWSHDLLDEREKTLFRRLAVFTGGWTLEAAEGICAFGELGEAEVFTLLEALVDRSLVVASPGGDGRFHFLEVIHEFARNELRASGEAATLGVRHCRWFARLAERAEPHLERRSMPYWGSLLEADLDNLRAAMAWAVADASCRSDGLSMAGGLTWFWSHRGYLAEAYETTRQLLASSGESRPRARLSALLGLSWFASPLLKLRESVEAARTASEIARELGDDSALCKALTRGSWGLIFSGDIEGGRRWVEEAVAVARERDLRRDLGFALAALQLVETELGEDEQAEAHLREALSIAESEEAPVLEAFVVVSRGEHARQHGHLEEARRNYARARDLANSLGVTRMAMLSTLNLALTSIQEGEHESARALLLSLLTDARGRGDLRVVALAVAGTAALEAERGNAGDATRWLAAALGEVTIEGPDRPVVEAALERCRERLGESFQGIYDAAAGTRSTSLIPEAVAALERDAAPPAAPGGEAPAGLSQREVEILRLVAGGRSNQEIAEELVLSRRTVETHVANAYSKIGAHNRAEAVRFALDSGLGAPAPA